tara:strand:- start:3501 stop:3668 length:168 start_codon:yes stop_codon:yes gene_type:complete
VNSQRPTSAEEGAFTLLEVIVALTAIGVLAAIAVTHRDVELPSSPPEETEWYADI